MRIGVLALQGDVREHLHALAACGAEGVAVRRPAELETVDGLVIPGGESTTISKLAVIFDLMEPLRARITDGLPTFGSCAGMILLADRILDAPADQESIGGIDMTVRRNAFGRQVDSFEEAVAIEGMAGPPLPAVFIRAPWVEQVGPAAHALASVVGGPDGRGLRPPEAGGLRRTDPSGGAGRVVAVRQGPLLATSFHPELTRDRRIHQYFCRMVEESAVKETIR